MADENNIGSLYFEQQRQTEESAAGSRMLQRLGLDPTGQPLKKETGEPAPKTPTPQASVIDMRAAAIRRAAALRKQIANSPKEEQPSFMRDVVGGTFTEIGRAIGGGATTAVKEMLESADSLAGFFNETLGTKKGGAFKNLAEMIPQVGENKTPGGEILRNFSQFATGFLPAGKVMKLAGVAGKVTKPMIAGLLTDIAAFDPNDPNLSNAINNLAPALKNPVTEFLATDPSDNEALNRFKRGLEGLGLGVAMDAVFQGFRLLRGRLALGRQEKAFSEGISKQATEAPTGEAARVLEPEVMPPTGGAGRADRIRPGSPAGQDLGLGASGRAGVMRGEQRALPAPAEEIVVGAPTGGAGRVDVLQPGAQVRPGDTGLGERGTAGVILGERRALPVPKDAPPEMRMSLEEVERLMNKGEADYERIRVKEIATRLARAEDDPTVLGINRQIRQLEEAQVDEAGRIASTDLHTIPEYANAIEAEVRADTYLKNSPYGESMQADIRRAELQELLRNSDVMRAATEEALKRDGEEIFSAMGKLRELDDLVDRLNALSPKPKTKRLSTIDAAAMSEGIADIKDADSLLAISLDDSIPRDIRRRAANKLNEFAIEDLNLGSMSREDVYKISRSGLYDNKIRAIAKGVADRLKSESGQVTEGALFAMTRAAVGGAIGLTQGDTIEERVGMALTLAGFAALASPALVKRFVGGFEKVAPKQTAILRSFEKPPAEALTRGQRKIQTELVSLATEANADEFLKANPGAITIGTTPLKINWENIGKQEDLDGVITRIARIFPKEVNEARRGVIRKELSDEMARRFGIRNDVFLGLQPGSILNVEKTKALIFAVGDSARQLKELEARLMAGQNVKAQFVKQVAVHADLTLKMLGVRAEQGRVLPTWGQAAELIEKANKFNQDFGLMLLGGKSLDEIPVEKLAQMVRHLDSEAQLTNFAAGAYRLGRNALIEIFVNGLLSAPVTHVANVTGNSIVIWSGIAERQIAGMMGKEVARGEAAQMIYSLSTGWREGLALAKKAWLTGESQFMLGGKIDTRHQRTITAENFGLSGDVGRAVDMLGAVVSTPGRALMAADDFFKAINYRMEMSAQAFRQASKEGITDPAKLAARLDELKASPAFQSMTKDTAENFAAMQTFNASLGDMGNGILKWLDDHPLARLVFPFVRTPANIAKYTLERTPLIGLGMKSMQADLAAGGAKREMALAKQAFGGMMFVTGVSLAAAGLITGSGPLDPKLRNIKRATGWQPYSFHIGNKYYSFSRLDPIGFMLGMSGDIVEKGGELNDFDVASLAMAGVVALKETFLNKTYLQGVSDVFEAVTANEPDKIERWGRRFAGSWMPAGIKAIGRMIDPTMREVNSAADALFSTLPGYGAPARRNIWGEKILLEGGVGPDLVSPIYTSTGKKDPISEEMLRLEVARAMPPRWIDGTRPTNSVFKNPDPRGGVPLSPEQYERFVELAGNDQKIDGLGLHDKLNQVIESADYKALPADMKRDQINKYFNVYQEAAVQQLLIEFDDLRDEVLKKRTERVEKMLTPEE